MPLTIPDVWPMRLESVQPMRASNFLVHSTTKAAFLLARRFAGQV